MPKYIIGTTFNNRVKPIYNDWWKVIDDWKEYTGPLHPDDPDYKPKTRDLIPTDFNPHCLGALKDPEGSVWHVVKVANDAIYAYITIRWGDNKPDVTEFKYKEIRDWERSNAMLDGWHPCVVEVES